MKHVIPEGQIVDFIDQKLRKDTPEEYVRQNIEQRLIREHKYNREDVKVEYTLNLGSRKPRADLVIFDKNSKTQTQDDIYIIIEEISNDTLKSKELRSKAYFLQQEAMDIFNTKVITKPFS